jgi:hypothetical protein
VKGETIGQEGARSLATLAFRVGARPPRIWQKHRIRLARNCIKPQISLSRMPPLRLNFIFLPAAGAMGFFVPRPSGTTLDTARTLFCSAAYNCERE